MFGDCFEVEDDINLTTDTAVLNSLARRPKNCAELLDMPEFPRNGKLIGLKNQGATCYLNSLIQACYMSPEFRNTILSLPLGDGTKLDFVDDPEKHQILLAFQKLFAQLKSADCRSVSTEELTQSFGWTGNEGYNQQDVQEANRVLFDVLNKALLGTNYNLTELYQGIQFNHITCQSCTFQHGREETFYDINVHVKGNQGLEEALFNYINPELLDGANQYFCELCGFKADALKGFKLRKIPSIFTIALNRYSFDYETMQRVKLNDRFEFPLEIDFSNYLEQEGGEHQYELTSVIIHRGNAHGGHYHAYFRDLLNEGGWQTAMADFWGEKQVAQKNTETIDYDEIEFPRPAINGDLNQNWFDFNDEFVGPIPVNRLQTQFGGAESAYILIYRKKDLIPKQLKSLSLPMQEYVNSLNAIREAERQKYNEAKQLINIQISDGNIIDYSQRKLISDKYEFTEITCKLDALINENVGLVEFVENYQTRLIHFTRALLDPHKTYEQEAVYHKSTWIRVDIKTIEHLIGIDKIPTRISFLYQGKPDNRIMFLCQTVSDLKSIAEEISGIPQSELQIKNLSNKQLISTMEDNLEIKQLSLTSESQLLIEQISNKKPDQEEKPNEDLISILVERDDDYGVNRYYVDINITLQELYEFIMTNLGLTDKRRLRKLNGGILFYKPELTMKLSELNFQEGGIRLLAEKGDVPDSGKMAIKAKSQSQYTQDKSETKDIIFDPLATTLIELKALIATEFNLDPAIHKIYKTDWLEEPIQAFPDTNQLTHTLFVREKDLIIISDLDSVVQCEFMRFAIHQTQTGFPDDNVYKQDMNIKKSSTLEELKQMIITKLELNCNINYLRVREIQKNYFFGQVLRNLTKPLNKLAILNHALVIQVLEQEENLAADEMLLVVKLRDTEKKIYIKDEIFFYKTKTFTIDELKNQIRERFYINQEIKTIELSKFQPHDFQWIHLTLHQEEKGNKKKGKPIQDNLKKPPFLLKEGDFIGYRIGDHPDDDFQTKEDQELRKRMLEARKNKNSTGGKRNQEVGFQIKLGFAQ